MFTMTQLAASGGQISLEVRAIVPVVKIKA